MKTRTLLHERAPRKTFASTALALCLTSFGHIAEAEPITPVDSWPGYDRHPLRQVAAAASNAYVTTSDGLQIFDLGDPEHPASLSFIGLFDYQESPTDIHLLSESNRLAIGVYVSSSPTKRIKGIDVSNPQDPQHVWTGSLHHTPNQVYQHGEKVYSSHNLNGLSVSYWGTAGSPAPVITNAWGRVVVLGTRLYVPTDSGFRVYNALHEDELLGSFTAGAAGHALAVDDALYVYLAAHDGLHVVSAGNPAAMPEAGFLPLDPGDYEPTDIRLIGDHACMTFANTNVFMMVSTTNPASPSIRGTYPFPGPVQNMAVDGNFAYVLAADVEYGLPDLHILDLSNPMHITETNRLYAHGEAKQLALDSDVLFLADSQNGLCVFNTASPTLTLIGQIAGTVNSVAADNGQVYASLYNGMFDMLYVYDVTDPETPVAVTNQLLFSPAVKIAVSPDFVCWTGDYGMTLSVADRNPQLTNVRQKYLSDIVSLDVVGDAYALVVDNVMWPTPNASLAIIALQDPSLQTLTNYTAAAPIVDVVGMMDAFRTNAILAITNGLEVLDLSDSAHFPVIASWTAPTGQIPRYLCVEGDRIALASTNQLWILDATQLNVGDPVLAETVIDHTVTKMALSGDLLYAAAGEEGVMVYRIGGGTILPSLQLTLQSPSQIELNWSEAGPGWQLQHNESLTNTSGWITLPGTELMTVTNLDTDVPCRFFRLIQ